MLTKVHYFLVLFFVFSFFFLCFYYLKLGNHLVTIKVTKGRMTPQVLKLRRGKAIQIYTKSNNHVLSDKMHYGSGGFPTIVKSSLITKKKTNTRKNTLNHIAI